MSLSSRSAAPPPLPPFPTRRSSDLLLIGTTLPFLMIPALHHLEGWNEATAKGAWGRAYRFVAEHIRQLVDLEHWAAFRTRSEEHTSELQSRGHLVCRLLLEKKKMDP